MCCQGCNRVSKILCGVASLLVLVGIIFFIITFTLPLTVKTVVDEKLDFTLDLSDPTHCGYKLYAKAALPCENIARGITLIEPRGVVEYRLGPVCTASDPDSWEATHDPKLQLVTGVVHMEDDGAKILGKYRVVSANAPLWALDFCAEAETYKRHMFTALGLFVAGIVLVVVGSVTSCVSCCCIDKAPTQVVVLDPKAIPHVVGEPVRAG